MADPFDTPPGRELTRRERRRELRRVRREEARSELAYRLRRVVGLLVAVAIGAGLAYLAYWLPGQTADDGIDDVPFGMRSAALNALDDARDVFFDTGIEQFLVTASFLDSIDRGNPPDACPAGTLYTARIRAITVLWIPYDDVLWCGSANGSGLFLTRQA